MGDDDRQLLRRMHRGHEASARALWAAHSPRMLAFARAIVRPRDAAEDVVQAVFCRVLDLPASRIAEVADPAAWLIQLTRHGALDFIRTSRRARRRERDSHARPAVAAGGSMFQLGDAELAAALDALPRRQREVVVLRHAAELSFEQISLAIGVNRNTIWGRYRAGLAALRNRLDRAQSPRSAFNSGVMHV